MAKKTSDMSWAYDRPLTRAVVVVDSPHGKTRRLAEALAEGIRGEHVPVDVLTVEEASAANLDPYDLIAVGSPNAWMATSPPVRGFLELLEKRRADGRYGYAFDTHTKGHPDGAAPEIVRHMRRTGLRVLLPPLSAPVLHRAAVAPAAGTAPAGTEYALEEGSEARFTSIGAALVRAIRNETAENWS